MSDIEFNLNLNHPVFASTPEPWRRSSQFVIGGEVEKMNFIGSRVGGPGFMDFLVTIEGLTIEEFKWAAISGFYKARIADAVNKGIITASAEGMEVTAEQIEWEGTFKANWVLQETYTNAGAGSNGAPVTVDQGIYVGDATGTPSYRITFRPGTTYDWQLYEYVIGVGWAAVAGHSGVGEAGSITGSYAPPDTVNRLYTQITYPAGGGDADLDIGYATDNYISTYDTGIVPATPDPVPVGDVGIDVTGCDRLAVLIDFVIPGGAPSVDVDLWARIGGVWGKVRAGAFAGITTNWDDWFGVDRAYERMYVQVTNIAAGVTVAKTLKAITLPY